MQKKEKEALLKLMKSLSQNNIPSEKEKTEMSNTILGEMIVKEDIVQLNFMVPGVKKEDIDISHYEKDGIKGIEVSYTLEQPENVIKSDLYYGVYKKEVSFIEDENEFIDIQNAKATLENGILSIKFQIEKKEKISNKITID